MDKILLNWLPPVLITSPSPSCSILKAFLQNNGYEIHVKYWNIIFKKIQDEILKTNIMNIEDHTFTLLPFLNYIAQKSKDYQIIDKINYRMLSLNPQWTNFSQDFVGKKTTEYCEKLEELIDTTLAKMDIEEYMILGMSSKLFQWVPANILTEKIKSYYPSIPVVMGGFGSKEEAYAMIKNFSLYDFAIWGEGEYPLLELLSAIKSGSDMKKIPYLVYREKEKIIVSQNTKKQYFNINDLIPDNSDFFSQITDDKEFENISFTIEGSRGCHWQQCRFCYLNDGYKYRKKDINVKVAEIKSLITKHQVSRFIFLDNDIIGNNMDEFDKFLDKLIEIREETNEFKILLGEVITKSITSNIIKKMAFAGFTSVQIGYESPSNELLKKIHKKNSYASNLLFIKWASFFNISISGLNVLTGLIEETQDDIIEGINNLKYMRFFLKKHYFEHNMSTVAVFHTYRYLKEMNDDEKTTWNRDNLSRFLPKGYVDIADRFKFYQYASNNLSNAEFWEYFALMESYYKTNLYEYKLIKLEEKIFYKELFNKELINELEFDNPLHISILSYSNHKTVSLNDLSKVINIDESEIIKVVDELNEEGLLYKSNNYDEIVSVINVDLIL